MLESCDKIFTTSKYQITQKITLFPFINYVWIIEKEKEINKNEGKKQ